MDPWGYYPHGGEDLKDLRQRVAYLNGLAEGLNLDRQSPEGRVIGAMLSLFGDIAESVDSVKQAQGRLEDYVECLDEDLGELEEEFYGEEAGKEYVETVCPRCGEKVYFDESLLTDESALEITCPNCGEVVYEYDELLDGDDEEPDEAPQVDDPDAVLE